MRGPFWNNGKTGVTGEPAFRSTPEGNYETYLNEEDGRLHTRVLAAQTVEEHGDQN